MARCEMLFRRECKKSCLGVLLQELHLVAIVLVGIRVLLRAALVLLPVYSKALSGSRDLTAALGGVGRNRCVTRGR